MVKPVQAFLLCALFSCFAFSCKQDPKVSPGTGNPETKLGKDLPEETYCGGIISGDLVNAKGEKGSQNPFGADIFGSWDAYATMDEMVVRVNAADGWHIQNASAFLGNPNDNPEVSPGIPFQENYAFTEEELETSRIFRWKLTEEMKCPAARFLVMELVLVERDYVGNPFFPTKVWFSGIRLDDTGTKGVEFCAEPCSE